MNKYIFLGLLLIVFPFQLIAHGAHGTGFTAGFTHPIFGIDHLVAIIATAILGHTISKEKPWMLSLFFIVAMVIGGSLGINAEELSITEWMIVISVLLTGSLIALEWKGSTLIYGILIGIFGFFHGHAHGTEMPTESNVLLYILGFVVGASLLSAIGLGASKFFKSENYLRILGAFIAGMGMMMLIG